MPNNNRCIESQLMKRFLQESHLCSLSLPDDEFSEQLSPLFPRIKQAGSLADTMLATSVRATSDVKEWTLDSLGSSINLPKFNKRCVLDSRQRDSAITLYSQMYSVSVTDDDIAHTCSSYALIVFNGKFFGTHNSRSAASSVIIGHWDSNLFKRPTAPSLELRAARIDKLLKHTVTIIGEVKVHLLASLSWYKAHPRNESFGKPTSVWYHDLFEYCGLVPIQLCISRAVTLIDKLNGEFVLFAVPCVE